MKKISYNIFYLVLILLLISCNDIYAQDEDDTESNCKIENGTHSAAVSYYNPNTGHKASYMLDVEVEDCEVTVIYFPKGGWLDDDHIKPAEIDSDGEADVKDDDGRKFHVEILPP